MPLDVKSGQTVKVTIAKTVAAHAARMTLERLFLTDKAVRAPIDARSANFVAIPKRRGGRIWTKRPNKLHPSLAKGASATIKLTPQFTKDLASVEKYVSIATA